MTVRTDVVINWTVSPRLIMVEAPSTTITVQDLVDTLRDLESGLPAMNDKRILGATGKDQLGGSRFVGITATLQDAQLTFEARGGPSFATCTVTDGNLVAVDAADAIIDAIAPSDYTWVRQELDVSPGLIETGTSGLTPQESADLAATRAAAEAAEAAADTAATAAGAAETAADTAAVSAGDAETAATAAEVAALSAEAKAQATLDAIDLLTKIETNRAVIVNEGDGSQTITIYDDDNVTPIHVHTVNVTKTERLPV